MKYFWFIIIVSSDKIRTLFHLGNFLQKWIHYPKMKIVIISLRNWFVLTWQKNMNINRIIAEERIFRGTFFWLKIIRKISNCRRFFSESWKKNRKQFVLLKWKFRTYEGYFFIIPHTRRYSTPVLYIAVRATARYCTVLQCCTTQRGWVWRWLK